MKRYEGSIMYLRNKESEDIRNEIEMQKLREKLISVRFKHKTVQQFENLIEDDRKILTDIYYPSKTLAIINDGATVFAEDLHDDEIFSEEDYSVADHRPKEDTKQIITNSEDDDGGGDGDDVPLNIDFDGESVKSEGNNTMDDDLLQMNKKRESMVKIDDNKSIGELLEEHGEYECFTDIECETNVSETAIYNKAVMIDSVQEIQMTTTETSGLTTFEAFGVARMLEKWIDWINNWDRTENESFYSRQTDYQSTLSFGMDNCKQLSVFMSKTLGLTVQELRSSNTFAVLQRANNSILKEISDERVLEMEHKTNRDKLDELRIGKKKYKRRYNVEEKRIKIKIHNFTTEFEKITKLVEMENEYLRMWEDRWLAENKELLREEEVCLLGQMHTIEDEITIENNYVNEAKRMKSDYIEDLKGFAQTWEMIYNKYVGAIDIDILTLEQEEENLNELHQMWQTNVDELQTSINIFEERKRERDERMQHKTYVNDMAIRIQAFWRGTMVRRFLGPYKRLRKKLKKKSTKKTTKKLKK